MKRRISKTSSYDYIFLTSLVLLIVFGLVMLTSASSDVAKAKFGDSFYYLKHQIIFGFLPGLFGFFVGFLTPFNKWKKLSFILFLIGVLLMISVFIPGIQTKGAQRWVDFGFFSFQPGEVMKLVFLIYLAAWLSSDKERIKKFAQGFVPFVFLTVVTVVLFLAQFSTAPAVILLASGIIVYFAAGGRVFYLILAFTIIILLCAFYIYSINQDSDNDYRWDRIKVFLNNQIDNLGKSYHINQSLLSIGSGGVFGVGFGQSVAKVGSLPEPIGDSIFAVIAEELGFVGASALILCFYIFIWRGFKIARSVPDAFGRLLAVGFVSLIGIQAFVNMAAISGLIPLTGVPLPFISYGGTALTVFLTMAGIIANISLYRREKMRF